MPLQRRFRKVTIVKHAWVVSVCCAMALLLCAVPCIADAGAHAPGYVESKPGTAKMLCASELNKAGALSDTGYIGIWADANHYFCDASPIMYTLFDAWIWCVPSQLGLIAAEFAVSIPATVILISTVKNPDIVQPPVLEPPITQGASVMFNSCQYEWTWTHHLTCMELATIPDVIQIIPHPGVQPQPAYQFHNCEPGYPVEPCVILTNLYLYGDCNGCVPTRPVLTNVTVESSTVIHAFFDVGVMPPILPTSDHFFLYDKATRADTIRCILAEMQCCEQDEYTLTLASEMVDNTIYMLQALQFYQNAGPAGDSKWEFTYHAPTATLLQSCSASFAGSGVEIAWELSEVDEGIEFFVSRSEGGADFLPLDMSGLVREGLDFTYTDSRVEPGERYVYKVEYTIDGKSRLLFISEEIRTPAALLALDQNRPNPFNPSTTISFTLPGECAVRLEVYDVSGRLVARLLDGKRLGAGAHNVEWNGRDASGRSAASGIYVYRLTAGRETISRKMVLLR